MPRRPLRSAAASLRRRLIAASLATVGALPAACSSPDGRLLFDGYSEYHRVRVIEHADGLRSLYLDGGRTRQSSVYPGRPLHLEFEYTRVGMIGVALAPPEPRILFVGLGGGAMPMYVRHILADARIETVELDPLVVAVAHRYFGFVSDERSVVRTGDGRTFIEDADGAPFDLIVLDAYADDGIPLALATRQFLEAVRARLAPRGVVIANVWTSAPEYPSMIATYAAVFPELQLLRVAGYRQRIVVATDRDRSLARDTLIAYARALQMRAALGFDLVARIERGYEPPALPAAGVLDDSLLQRTPR